MLTRKWEAKNKSFRIDYRVDCYNPKTKTSDLCTNDKFFKFSNSVAIELCNLRNTKLF